MLILKLPSLIDTVTEALLPVAVTLLLVVVIATVGFATAVAKVSRTAARDTAASARETDEAMTDKGK